MSGRLVSNIIRFLSLVLVQVLVFNHIEFSGYINPYVYILFIILMPFETPGWVLLLTGFILGYCIDYASNTLGIHTFATVFIAFLRPFVLNSLAPRDGYENGTYPRVFYHGLTWFSKYTIILVFAHHFVLFYLEVFRISDFFSTLLRVILSSIFTFIFIILSQFFVYRK